MRPILLLEINEVPWRLLDHYQSSHPLGGLDRFIRHSATYTNCAVDSGELSPWITWPTVHRGVNKETHQVLNLGQDPDTFRGKPIWQNFLDQGKSVGICGSLQSWPPVYPGKNGFYVPDTFAHDARCIPAWVDPLQRFNLQQTGTNGRQVNRSSLLSMDTLKFLKTLPFLGIRLPTLWRAGKQLISEFFDKNLSARRPTFQGLLMWDVFLKLYDPKNPPEFATFFTNHVAGAMHRYWHDVFPGDFSSTASTAGTHINTMNFAMKVLDEILEEAMSFVKQNPSIILVFASSMGQEAIHRESQEGKELRLSDVGKILNIFGVLDSTYLSLLAMTPQVAIEIASTETRKKVVAAFDRCFTASGEKLFAVIEISKSLSITLINPKKEDVHAGFFSFDGREVHWEDAGIQIHSVEAGTGYHTPEGAMMVYGKGIAPDPSRKKMNTDEIKNFLLNLSRND